MANNPRLRWLIIPILGMLLIGFFAIPFSPICNGLWSKLIAGYDLLIDRERVQGLVQASGWASPLILIALHVAQVLLAPIPGDAFCILGGYLFGTFNGFLLSTLGMTIGSVLNFYFGRIVGNRVVRRIVSARTYAKYNRLVQGNKDSFDIPALLSTRFSQRYVMHVTWADNHPNSDIHFTVGCCPHADNGCI